MSEKIIAAMRRQLEKWELDHLRRLAAELQERLDRSEAAREYAEECAISWQDDAMRLSESLMEAGATVGLTQDGAVVQLTPVNPALWALLAADEFMSGFEDDPEQKGIGERLSLIRAAIAALQEATAA